MRAAPCRGAKNDLDLLTSRETSHGVVRNEFGLQAKISEVLLDLATNKGAEKTNTLRFASVNLNHFLYKKKGKCSNEDRYRYICDVPFRSRA